jgi:putative acetyltransferase
MLIEAGLELMRGGAYPAVVVVGSPKYYARFGFLPASQWGLHYVGDASEDDLMAVELSPGSLAGIRGLVRFRPEFAGIQALRMTGQP